MRYKIDHDIHIHSQISDCSSDPEQTPERILQYAREEGLTTVCVTDHFWDENVDGPSDWYSFQNYPHVSRAKPLPQDDGIRFLFGCETEMRHDRVIGISPEKYDLFDFIIVPTTHFHMRRFTVTENESVSAESLASAWVDRFESLLNMDLPFHKVGVAHLTCGLIGHPREQYIEILSLIPDGDMERVFTKAASLGIGIELNASDMGFADHEADVVLRPYRIAKRCGCKFYLGSDAHHPSSLERAKERFEKAIDLLGLEENDKFVI